MSSGRISIVFIVLSMSLSAIQLWSADPGAGGTPSATSFSPATRGTSADGWPMFMADSNHTGHVSAPVPMDNSTLWSKTIPGLKPFDSPVVQDGVVYIGSGDSQVRGLDIDSGMVVWSVPSMGQVSAPVAIDSGDIFFGSDDGYAHSYDIAKKVRNWRVNLNATSIQSSPTVYDDLVFIGTHSLTFSKFYALNILDGSVKWYLTMDGIENSWGFKSSAVAFGGSVYVGNGAGRFYCIDQDGFEDGNDGETTEPDPVPPYADIIWHADLDTAIIGSPMLAEGYAFIGSSAGWFYKFDAVTGAQLWKVRLGSGEWPSLSTTPSYHDGMVYVTCKRDMGGGATGGSVYAIDADGDRIAWRYNITKTITESSPTITDDYLFFGARDSKLYCLRTDPLSEDNRVLWKRDVGSPISSSAAISNGRVFVSRPDPYGDGKIIAFGTPDPYIDSISVSDPYMLEGESVQISVHLRNNGTVATRCDVQFKATTVDFSPQVIIAKPGDILVGPFGETEVSVPWRAVQGLPIIVATISAASPGNREVDNDFLSMEVFVETSLAGYWVSAGSGSELDSAAKRSVESNRTLWEKDHSYGWSDATEGIWFDSFGGSGSVASIGSTLFYVDPDGAITSLYYPEGIESPGLNWRYMNSSVKLEGRPALLVDKDQSQAFPNKVFAIGDDGYLWAFDWIGFKDGKNDGPFLAEESTRSSDGDVIWRSPLSERPDSPLMITAANPVFRDQKGVIRSFDDDTGTQIWTYKAGIDAPMAANAWNVFVAANGSIAVLDSGFGSAKASIPMSGLFDGKIRSIAVRDPYILITHDDGLLLLDSDPDDNGDGKLDRKDLDEGLPDNISSGRDVVWRYDLSEPSSTPASIDYQGRRIAVCSGSTLHVLSFTNGTLITDIPLSTAPSGRIVAGDMSFYVVTGTSPWTINAYKGTDLASPSQTWRVDLWSEPMGELALSGGAMFITLREGKVLSIGALNSPPIARIMKPLPGMLVFPDEQVELDGSPSEDPQGDALTYRWYIYGHDEPLYEGPSPHVNLTIQGMGKVRLVLRVLDDMRSYTEDSVNITVLKRVTEPDHIDYVHDVRIHMSYGISDPNGRGYVTLTSPEGAPADKRIVFLMDLEFKLLQQYALYRFEFANITISLAGKEFPLRMEEEMLGIFERDEGTSSWVKASETGFIPEENAIWGNFSSLETGTYALGILDNRAPDIRHKGSGEDIARAMSGPGYIFSVEYRDLDGDEPLIFKMTLDNDTSYNVANDGFLVDHRTFNSFQTSSVLLPPGTHTYFFEVSDGRFTVKSRYYQITIPNQKPIIQLLSPTKPVSVGSVILFDASGSFDDDGSTLEFSWDFDKSNGIQREDVRSKVDHIYYEVGVFTVTLTVTDGIDQVVRTITVTVIDDRTDDRSISQTTLFLLLLAFVAVLGVALAIFLVLTRKGVEHDMRIEEAGSHWTCPECGVRASPMSVECDRCGYEYDRLDFQTTSEKGSMTKKGYLDREM